MQWQHDIELNELDYNEKSEKNYNWSKILLPLIFLKKYAQISFISKNHW